MLSNSYIIKHFRMWHRDCFFQLGSHPIFTSGFLFAARLAAIDGGPRLVIGPAFLFLALLDSSSSVFWAYLNKQLAMQSHHYRTQRAFNSQLALLMLPLFLSKEDEPPQGFNLSVLLSMPQPGTGSVLMRDDQSGKCYPSSLPVFVYFSAIIMCLVNCAKQRH